jgi:hypothetical protein
MTKFIKNVIDHRKKHVIFCLLSNISWRTESQSVNYSSKHLKRLATHPEQKPSQDAMSRVFVQSTEIIVRCSRILVFKFQY